MILANTHLYWNPAFEVDCPSVCNASFDDRVQDVKLLQISCLLERLTQASAKLRVMYDVPHVGVVVCGDLNSLPNSEVYTLLAKGVASKIENRCRLPVCEEFLFSFFLFCRCQHPALLSPRKRQVFA